MKKLFVLLAISLVGIVLAGCMTAQVTVRVRPDGTGEQETILAFDKDVYALMMSSGGQDPLKESTDNFTKQGAQVSRYEKDNRVGIRAVKTIPNLSYITWSEQGWNGRFDVTRSLFWKDYSLDLDVDMTSDFPPEAMAFAGQADIGVSVELPTSIKEHNGQASSDLHQVKWSLIPGRNEHIMLRARQYLWGRIAVAGAVVLVIVAAVVMRRRRPPTAQPATDVAAGSQNDLPLT